jgi:uncharacterized membrane protein
VSPEAVSQEAVSQEGLQQRPGATLAASRMAIAMLSLVGLIISAYLSLYKLGFLGFIQCTTGGCETVQSSRYAFFVGIPVAVWGVGAYLVLLVLALIGLQPGLGGKRWVGLALFGAASAGVLFTAYLTYLEAYVIHAWCQWCLVSAALVTLIFLSSIPGLRYAR